MCRQNTIPKRKAKTRRKNAMCKRNAQTQRKRKRKVNMRRQKTTSKTTSEQIQKSDDVKSFHPTATFEKKFVLIEFQECLDLASSLVMCYNNIGWNLEKMKFLKFNIMFYLSYFRLL